ncbi:MAG TPA: VOC family protein [Gemmataceae bacterium]|nr:VOC family protein [Gemmataceae bacterium]
MANDPGYFTWYELMTTDVAAAAVFYRDVVGWTTQEASTSKLSYKQFTTGGGPTAGLMELPDEGRKMGARPRWMGYVGVSDVHVAVDRIKRLGGVVYVPPTDTNIGRISVVADPQAAPFAVVDHLQTRPQQPAESGKVGRVGWHELLAADLEREFAFYCELFGWQKADADGNLAETTYHLFSAGGQVIGGAFEKRPDEPVPFWLFYFNVGDLDAAAERVEAAGGRAFVNPMELLSGLSVARCVDPQGAAFGLQGRRGSTLKMRWSTEWGGISSRGQLVTPKPRRGSSGEGSQS